MLQPSGKTDWFNKELVTEVTRLAENFEHVPTECAKLQQGLLLTWDESMAESGTRLERRIEMMTTRRRQGERCDLTGEDRGAGREV